MSRRAGTRTRATRKPVVVIAGEDRNDRQVIRTLLEEFCPDMRGRIVEINDSVRLRSASHNTLGERVRKLARLVKARARREDADLACVFVHEDLDGPASADYVRIRGQVQEALGREFASAHYILAAAEIEAWLLMFPEAVAAHVSSWRVPQQYRNRDTGQLTDPKQIMMTEVSRSGRTYRESDAPAVIAAAVRCGSLDQPAATNRSWTQLRTDAGTCCADHLPRQRGTR